MSTWGMSSDPTEPIPKGKPTPVAKPMPTWAWLGLGLVAIAIAVAVFYAFSPWSHPEAIDDRYVPGVQEAEPDDDGEVRR